MEHEYDDFDPSEGFQAEEEHRAVARRFGLGVTIGQAFRQASARNLRQWYVETFVLDPSNTPLLSEISPQRVTSLMEMFHSGEWPTIEHAAIGHRLVYAIQPDLIAPPPNILEPDEWRNEADVTNTVLRICAPWEHFRYDPDGENWYRRVRPGQWQRHGKGKPGEQAVENAIAGWLTAIDPNLSYDPFEPWLPMYADLILKLDADTVTARQAAVKTSYKKFRKASTTLSKVRQTLERSPIMHLDTSTLNQVKTVTPFSNGALALVPFEYRTTTNQTVRRLAGELLPMDIEFMVTNANPLPWHDTDGEIAKAANDAHFRGFKDSYMLEEIQNRLLVENCPTYWSFLTHAFPGEAERDAFMRLLGAAMFGTNLKIVAAMIGEPNAGKDTVINWLSYLMPGQVATLPFSAFTPYGDEDRSLAPLLGRRVATVSGEVGEGRGSKLLAEKIKTVTSGGGTIRVAEKYEKPTTINFDGMLFLQGNSVPQIAGGDTALYTNRLVAVEFVRPFPLQARSYEPEYTREAPWFAMVLFISYLIYQAEGGGMSGINPPESWRTFAKEFADASNPHGWLERCIDHSSEPIPTQQFHQALTAMVQRFGSPYPVGQNFWPKRLKALGYDLKGNAGSVRRKVMRNGVSTLCYYLKVDAEKSDGAFSQEAWNKILHDAAVTAN